jgi:uncharacterized phiE125 gp8 family phage protein
MNTKVKSDYIITLFEAKQHLRVDTTDEDNYILNLIRAAVGYAENYIQKDIVSTTNTLVLEDFSGVLIEVNEAPFVSLTSVKDVNGAALVYDYLKIYDSYFTLELEQSQSESTVTLEFVTGYTNATLPAAIRQAVLIKIADLYDVDRNTYGFQNYQKAAANNAFEALLNYYMANRVKHIRN